MQIRMFLRNLVNQHVVEVAGLDLHVLAQKQRLQVVQNAGREDGKTEQFQQGFQGED